MFKSTNTSATPRRNTFAYLVWISLFCVVLPAAAKESGGMALRQVCAVQAWRHPYCARWMNGVVAGIYVGQELQQYKHPICLPTGVSGPQILLIVQRFMHRHPEDLNETATGVIAHALYDAYPCSKN